MSIKLIQEKEIITGKKLFLKNPPKKLLFIELNDCLLEKNSFNFKYNMQNINWEDYKVIVISHETKTANIIDKITPLNAIECDLEIYISKGVSSIFYKKPSTEIPENVIKSIVEKENEAFTKLFEFFDKKKSSIVKRKTEEFIKDLISLGSCENVFGKLEEEELDKFNIKKIQYKAVFEIEILQKVFPFKEILFVGEDLNFYKNFCFLKNYLEEEYKYELPNFSFKCPEEFFLNKKIKQNINEFSFDPWVYYSSLEESRLIYRPDNFEIVYIIAPRLKESRDLAQYIREKWDYSRQIKEPPSKNFLEDLQNKNLRKSYVFSLNNFNFSYVVPDKTRVIVIEPLNVSFERKIEILKHFVISSIRLENEKYEKTKTEEFIFKFANISNEILEKNLFQTSLQLYPCILKENNNYKKIKFKQFIN